MKTAIKLDKTLLSSDYIKEGITITNPNFFDKPLLYVNEGFCLMTGYTKKEVLGKSCRFLQRKKTNQKDLQRLKTAVINKEDTVQEIITFKNDGTHFWNRLSITYCLYQLYYQIFIKNIAKSYPYNVHFFGGKLIFLATSFVHIASAYLVNRLCKNYRFFV